MEFKIRKEIWDKKSLIESSLRDFFSIIQNPILASREDLFILDKSYERLMVEIQTAKNKIDKYLGSKENVDEYNYYENKYNTK